MIIRLFFLCFIMSTNQLFALELNTPVLYDRGISPRTEEQKQASYISYDVLEEEDINVYALLSLTNLGSSDIWYNFTRDLDVYSVDVKNKKLLNHWPLTPWAYRQRPKLIAQAQLNYWTQTPWKEKITYMARLPYAGCLNRTPLRYGDIEQDGEKELVLLLNGELIVFSPNQSRTVFSTFYQADDWYREMDVTESESDMEKSDAQYLSEILYLNGIKDAAYRYYSKIYLGDFNQNGQPDILVWSKTYQSNKKDEQIGFHLVENKLQHFERDLTTQQKSEAGVTGEYLPQDTRPETIQGWLNAKNLTWQKGFPSKSECTGEEGELIPEMHDPLLNDPDVLK